MKKKYRLCLTVLMFLLISTLTNFAQSTDLSATLEVLSGTVEVQRSNTGNWIKVNVEAIIARGDSIRTGEDGQARITFFADGVETDILPNTQLTIDTFQGSINDGESFDLEVTVVIGQTLQRIGRALEVNSSYNVNTPGMVMGARGTEFVVRVEDSGRAGMLVSEGNVDAESQGVQDNVPPEFGIRSAVNEGLSDVVRASTFDELDSVLDGCSVSVNVEDDIQFNLRIAPSNDAKIIGTVTPESVNTLVGITETTQWYRVKHDEGFAWIRSSQISLDDTCPRLRVFPDNYTEEQLTYPYTVQAGDTLFEIARQHNIAIDTIQNLNPIVDINRIYSGQTLILPVKS